VSGGHMDFQSYFFKTIKMSSDDVFDELTFKLSTTNPGSWLVFVGISLNNTQTKLMS